MSNIVLLPSFSTHKHTSMVARSILSFFFGRTVNSKPPTTPFGIVACTFSDNLSRNSCKHFFHSLCATRTRKHFKLCARLLSSYEYLVNLSISVVVLGAYALNVFFFRARFPPHTRRSAGSFPKKAADNLPVLEKKCLADCEFEK